MPFTKGTPKPINSGRKPTGGLKASVQQALAKLKCDPIEGMVLIAQDDKNPVTLRGRMFAELAQYVYPKRRAIEMSGPEGAPIELNVSAREQILSRIAGLASRRGTGTGS